MNTRLTATVSSIIAVLAFTFALTLGLPFGLTFESTVVAGAADQPGTEVTPESALQELIAGNKRFIAGQPTHPDDHKLSRTDLISGQAPIAAILACSDSRVPPDTIFDQGPGTLFMVRVAGNTADLLGEQSLGYAIVHLHTPLIVVLGHDSCGAVKAAVTAYPKLGVGPMLSNIYPAIRSSHDETGDPVSNAINANVVNQVELLSNYAPFAERIKSGKLKIVGARYSLSTGQVNFLTK